MKPNWTVDFEPVGRRVPAREGQTLLAVAQEAGLALGAAGVTAPCGGRGLCGRCRIKIAEGILSPPTEAEKRALSPAELNEGYRLACQAALLGPVKVEIPPEAMVGVQKLQVEGLAVEVTPEPPVARYTFTLEPTTNANPRPLWQQVVEKLAADYNLSGLQVDLELARRTSPLAAEGSGTVTVKGKEIIHGVFGRPVRPALGLAVDLGTTKVAGFLVNLETGATLASEGIMNPQIAYGEDVMARMSYALEGEEQYRRIHQVIIEGLNSLAGQLAEQVGVQPEDIEEAVIVGNTAMHHLLLRLPLHYLARAPYVPAVTAPVEIKARDLGLKFSPGAYVYCVPVIAGFVGGDHVAMILGSRLDEANKVTLGLDIGTNTEIVLKYGRHMLSCSCASGPAFEGAHILHGMRAVRGAVQAVRLGDEGRKVEWETVGDEVPLGICGSGILDAVAELYRTGVIDARGRLNRRHPRVRAPEGAQAEFILVPAAQSGTGRDIVITQKDIGEIQLAKAAIASGTKLLLEAAGLDLEDIQEVVVAGAFGTHLKVASAVAIGMFPALPLEVFRQVGNAAGTGARMALLSLTERRRAEEIARNVGYVELMVQPSFQETFLSSLALPERRAG
ncbi:ASKHA domain-containing protein [Moorellaceae bacterium AZ2]